ncbi:MAG TPA: hypothetical protein VE824_05245 [Gaiellales bacterium]|nr:hypothetical protein [Gaiellales bacterium]
MATKTDFSETEWDQLHTGVTGAGMLVAMSDRGFWDSFKEAQALAKHLADAHQRSDRLLVRDLAGEKGTGFSVRDNPTEVEQATIAALQGAVATLQQKAPDELDAYKNFVVDVAQSVSAAAKGGDEVEAAAIAKIKQALGA